MHSSVEPSPFPARLVRKLQFSKYGSIQSIFARDQYYSGGFAGDEAGNLSRIELRIDSIESIGVNGFELSGIDLPLIRRDLQSVE